MLQVGFPPPQNLCSGYGEWSCAIVITTTPKIQWWWEPGQKCTNQNKNKLNHQRFSKVKPIINLQIQSSIEDKPTKHWEIAKLNLHGGKAKAKYKHCWNTTNSKGEQTVTDFSLIHRFEILTQNTNTVEAQKGNTTEDPTNLIYEFETDDIWLTQTKENIIKAKEGEIEQWRKCSIYTEKEDLGQLCIYLRWVVSQKIINGNSIFKARFVLFDKEHNFSTDSPKLC